jgi:hypothetical protein
MMQDVHVKLIENCQGIDGIQQDEGYLLPAN